MVLGRVTQLITFGSGDFLRSSAFPLALVVDAVLRGEVQAEPTEAQGA